MEVVRCRLCAEQCPNSIDITEDTLFIYMLECFFQLKLDLGVLKSPSTVCEGCYEFVERVWQFKEQVDRAQILLKELSSACVVSAIEEPPAAPAEADTSLVGQDPSVKNKKVKKTKPSKHPDEEVDTFKEVEFVNADGSITPKQGVAGWNSYHWTCSECSTVFFEVDELREHYATTHNVLSVKYLCVDCPKVYSKYVSFVGHVRHHRPPLKYSCDMCYKWYLTPKEVETHQTCHNEEDPFHCSVCGKTFRLQSLLNLHTRSHLPSDVKNCYPCNHCSKKFGTKPNLMAHKRIHLGIKEYTCHQCGKSFVQKGNLDNHLLTHNSARPFQCTVCDKSFKSLIRLRKHNLIHSGLKPHQCDICGRQFRERGTLKEHHRIHTGAMPFTCEFCGKSFRFKGVLTTHRRQHTGERPYSCTECQHHFTNWPNYNKHMKRRHGINTSVNCRTKQEIPPTGKPNRNPPGTILAAPQPPPPVQVICQTGTVPMEVYNETSSASFYPVLGLYGIAEDIA